LDVVRAQQFIGELKGKDPLSIKVNVVGGHSPETMIPVLSQVQGITFTDAEAQDLTKRIKNAGTVVVDAKEGSGSATLSMAYAGARFVYSLVHALEGKTGIVECCYVETQNIPAVETSYFGLPVELGKEGIFKIHPLPKLNDYESHQLKEAVATIKQNIETGLSFVSKL